jgi:hypothetical protein
MVAAVVVLVVLSPLRFYCFQIEQKRGEEGQ